MAIKNGLSHCSQFSECKVVPVPYVIDRVLAAGWIFPKGSSLYHLFDAYISVVRESGLFLKMKSSYKDERISNQVCPNYAGKPVGLAKCFSLFGLLSCGAAFSAILLV